MLMMLMMLELGPGNFGVPCRASRLHFFCRAHFARADGVKSLFAKQAQIHPESAGSPPGSLRDLGVDGPEALLPCRLSFG